MWHSTADVDLDFTTHSPERMEFEIICFAPAERVFDVLTGDREFPQWLEPLAECRWTTPGPHAVGSKREIVLDMLAKPGQGDPGALTALAVKERILAWERGKRFAFAIEALTIPLVRRMVEDMQLERLGPNKTRLRYHVHYEPTLIMRAVHPIAREFFGKMFRDAVRKIAMIAARPMDEASSSQPRA
jgi:uncharacterized protein YndB with AHSA1/START domain